MQANAKGVKLITKAIVTGLQLSSRSFVTKLQKERVCFSSKPSAAGVQLLKLHLAGTPA